MIFGSQQSARYWLHLDREGFVVHLDFSKEDAKRGSCSNSRIRAGECVRHADERSGDVVERKYCCLGLSCSVR